VNLTAIESCIHWQWQCSVVGNFWTFSVVGNQGHFKVVGNSEESQTGSVVGVLQSVVGVLQSVVGVLQSVDFKTLNYYG